MKASRIVLIGSGAVGSTFAYTALLRGLVDELVIIDANQRKAEGDVLDLNHGLMLAHPMRIWAGDYPDCAGAAIVVVAAGAAQLPGETRIDLMHRNVAILREMLIQVTRYTQDAVLLIATNPVDILTHVAYKLSGWPRQRVVGSGTLLDSSRFRYLIALKLGVDPRSVHGMIIGEHGETEVPVWSSLNVAGLNPEAATAQRWQLTEADKEEIYQETREAAYKIISRKGATYYAIALALSRICEAILHDQKTVLPVSSYLEGYLGVSGVCLGVPTVVGRGGAEEVLPLPLSPDEEDKFRLSAETLKQFLASIGF